MTNESMKPQQSSVAQKLEKFPPRAQLDNSTMPSTSLSAFSLLTPTAQKAHYTNVNSSNGGGESSGLGK